MKRILFILNHKDLTGVNTFNYTLIEYIKGYAIDVYIPYLKDSLIASKLSEFANIVTEIKDIYDIVYFNYEQQNGFYEILSRADKRFFVHGLMTPENIPTKQYNKVYCFGERAFNYIQSENKVLIRNYINLDRFEFEKPTKLEKILIHSSRDSQILLSPIIAAASKINCYVSFTGSDFLNLGKVWNVEGKIRDSNLVIGKGRCLIEAMAMGKSALLFGINHGEGLITPSNFWVQAETNFSGWLDKKINFDLSEKCVTQLIEEFKKYNIDDIYKNYELIKEHFDIKKHINKIL